MTVRHGTNSGNARLRSSDQTPRQSAMQNPGERRSTDNRKLDKRNACATGWLHLVELCVCLSLGTGQVRAAHLASSGRRHTCGVTTWHIRMPTASSTRLNAYVTSIPVPGGRCCWPPIPASRRPTRSPPLNIRNSRGVHKSPTPRATFTSDVLKGEFAIMSLSVPGTT